MTKRTSMASTDSSLQAAPVSRGRAAAAAFHPAAAWPPSPPFPLRLPHLGGGWSRSAALAAAPDCADLPVRAVGLPATAAMCLERAPAAAAALRRRPPPRCSAWPLLHPRRRRGSADCPADIMAAYATRAVLSALGRVALARAVPAAATPPSPRPASPVILASWSSLAGRALEPLFCGTAKPPGSLQASMASAERRLGGQRRPAAPRPAAPRAPSQAPAALDSASVHQRLEIQHAERAGACGGRAVLAGGCGRARCPLLSP